LLGGRRPPNTLQPPVNCESPILVVLLIDDLEFW
jgi:hypothetical protein